MLYFSDRTTSADALDNAKLYEVTEEPDADGHADFSTLAWCPSQESADMVRAALAMCALLLDIRNVSEADSRFLDDLLVVAQNTNSRGS